MNDKLKGIKDRYETITEKTKERNGQITEVVTLAKKFTEHTDDLRDLLDKAESDIAKLDTTSCEEQDVFDGIVHVKVLNSATVDALISNGFLSRHYWLVNLYSPCVFFNGCLF